MKILILSLAIASMSTANSCQEIRGNLEELSKAVKNDCVEEIRFLYTDEKEAIADCDIFVENTPKMIANRRFLRVCE